MQNFFGVGGTEWQHDEPKMKVKWETFVTTQTKVWGGAKQT